MAWAKLGISGERGAKTAEYVLIVTLIALIVIVAALGNRVSTKLSSPSSALQ